jgi:predicted CoA-binding protein
MATDGYVPPDRETQRAILQNARVIAVVGFSNDPSRASYQIGHYLRRAGYTMYPVNPTITEVDGMKVYPSLKDVPEPIDIVDVFRRPEYLLGVVEEAIAVKAKVVWAQLGIADDEAARRAHEAGLTMVMNNCIMVTHRTVIHS